MKNFSKIFFILIIITINSLAANSAEESKELLKPDWSFKGYFGKFG